MRVVRFYVSLFSFLSFSSFSSSSDLNYDLVSSVWHAGPQPRSCDFSVACRTPTASSWVQCGVPDPNRDPASSVWRAGPQPRSREFSVACRTSTAIPRVQCGVPDPNRDHASSVWRAGPQPRAREFSVACRTSTAIGWNKRWLNTLEVYWHVWCLLFIPLICWQVVSWHDLVCLVQRMLLATHCNAFVIWACAVAATIAFDFASGGMLPCLMPVSLFIFDRWYPDMIWHVCCGMFWHVCFCQVVYWHVLANGCVLFTLTLLTGAILSSRQDTTRSCKNPEKKDAGLAGFEMHLLKSVWSLPANLLYFVGRLSAPGPWNKTR